MNLILKVRAVILKLTLPIRPEEVTCSPHSVIYVSEFLGLKAMTVKLGGIKAPLKISRLRAYRTITLWLQMTS